MAKYGKKTQQQVKEEMHKYKHEHRFKNPKQAIAVGLSEARRKGYKVPSEKK